MKGGSAKLAAPDTLVISQATLESLPRRIPVTPVGELTGGGRILYSVDRKIGPDDPEVRDDSGPDSKLARDPDAGT